jgi:hypothetical protein
MANLKIIWTTGSPFSSSCVNKIGYKLDSGKFDIYTGSIWTDQASYMGQGYRPATAREIAEHWDVLHPMWIPEAGDKVIITQDHDDWRNKRAVIVEGHYYEDYCRIKKEDGESTIFSKSSHMILAPYEETAKPVEEVKSVSTKQSIPLPKEGYVTVRLFTEEEFKSKGLWDTFGSKGYPKGWNMDGEMNKYLNTYLQIREVDFRPDKSFTYSGWNFKNTDYEVIHEGVKPKPEPKVESKVEPKEPEMKKQRFKVGDQVTYKSKPSCDGYRYGGNDHDGYVGTITSYLSYYSGNGCYGIQVTSREGNYTMLECEFHEYDGTYPGAVTLGTSAGSDLRIISAGTANTTFLGTVGLQIVQTVPKPKDDLAKYDQAPVTLHKKPKTKLITVNTY